MDVLSESEQWEAVKAWLRENGLAIVAGALLGVMLLIGWRWWQGHQQSQRLAANAAYESLLMTFDAGNFDASIKAFEQFQRDFGSSAYGPPAELAVARMYLGHSDLDKAATHLRAVADGARDEQLREVARARLARVLISQGRPDEALGLLANDHGSAYAALNGEVRGDALYAKGDKAGALREYLAARQARGEASANQAGADSASLLDLKINDLRAGATASAAAP